MNFRILEANKSIGSDITDRQKIDFLFSKHDSILSIILANSLIDNIIFYFLFEIRKSKHQTIFFHLFWAGLLTAFICADLKSRKFEATPKSLSGCIFFYVNPGLELNGI